MLLKSIVLAASAILASAGDLLPILPPVLTPILLLGQYKILYDKCIDDPSNPYVSVLYQNGSYIQFHSGECYPYSYGQDNLAQVAVFCRAVTCNNNPNPDCSGGAVPPIPVPLPPLTVLPNAGDWVQLLGQGAMCYENGLSGL